jgi:outer membrane lipoprotein-sorting protein
MTKTARAYALLTLLALVNTGCQSEHIPTYPLMDNSSSLRVLAERAKTIRTLSAQGAITLTSTDEQSVRLDAAMVSQVPDRMRLRAWKFGQAVFDLTLTPDGLFLITPDNNSRREQMKAAGASAADFVRTWSVLSGGLFESPNLRIEPTLTQLRITRAAAGEPTIICIVDRTTLTPRRYELIDDQGNRRFSLALDRYATVNNLVWPRRLVATSEQGTINIELREIEINGDLPRGAFVPPRRAERLP